MENTNQNNSENPDNSKNSSLDNLENPLIQVQTTDWNKERLAQLKNLMPDLFTALELEYPEPAEAVEFFTAGKDFVVKDKLLTAEFNFQLAESYMTMKKYAEAQPFYTQAFTLDPSNAGYLNNFAYRQAVHGVNLDKALEAIKKANEISPNSPTFLDTYAWVYFKMNNIEQALVYVDRAFRLNPKSATIAEHYGDILFKAGREARALELWLTSRQLGNTDELLQKKIDTTQYHERKP